MFTLRSCRSKARRVLLRRPACDLTPSFLPQMTSFCLKISTWTVWTWMRRRGKWNISKGKCSGRHVSGPWWPCATCPGTGGSSSSSSARWQPAACALSTWRPAVRVPATPPARTHSHAHAHSRPTLRVQRLVYGCGSQWPWSSAQAGAWVLQTWGGHTGPRPPSAPSSPGGPDACRR